MGLRWKATGTRLALVRRELPVCVFMALSAPVDEHLPTAGCLGPYLLEPLQPAGKYTVRLVVPTGFLRWVAVSAGSAGGVRAMPF